MEEIYAICIKIRIIQFLFAQKMILRGKKKLDDSDFNTDGIDFFHKFGDFMIERDF
jgi:hypothetical protein